MAYDFAADFPAMKHDDVIYLDSAATSQKPACVLEAERDYYDNYCANAARGSYDWSVRVDAMIAHVRAQVADYLGGVDADGVVFTGGATHALNMVALGWGAHNLKPGDEVLYCPDDHSALVRPWLELANHNNKIKMVAYKLNSRGAIDFDDLLAKVTGKTRVVNVTHMHNVSGVVNDLEAIRAKLPEPVVFNVDAAQSAAHGTIDAAQMGADFISFSSHKMLGATGLGVLWVAPRVQATTQPVFFGGGQAKTPEFFAAMECGTPHVAGMAGFHAALDYIMEHEGEMRAKMRGLTDYLYDRILKNPRIDLVFPVKMYEIGERHGVLAFNIENMESADVGEYLSQNGFCVRHGTHCNNGSSTDGQRSVAEKGSIRISLHVYNSKEDVDKICDILDELSEMAL